MDIRTCNGCGHLFDLELAANKLNGAKRIGFKNICSDRCELKVFPKLDPPNQVKVEFRKKQPWSAVPIDYQHFGSE